MSRLIGTGSDEIATAIARKNYDQCRQRQAQGIQKPKKRGVYRGQPIRLSDRIRQLLEKGFSIRKAAEMANASPSTVQKVKQAIPSDAA